MSKRNDVIVDGHRIIGGLRQYVHQNFSEKSGATSDACSRFLVKNGWTIVTEYNHEGREIRTHVEPGCTTDDWRLPVQLEENVPNQPKAEPIGSEVSPPLGEPEVVFAIRMLQLSQSLLRSQGVLRNKKDITSQLGEYVVLELFGGELAESGNQEGWDLIDADGLKVQVKSHAKAESNDAKYTPIKYTERKFDDLCIVRFTPNYSDVVIHRLSFDEAFGLVTSGTLSWGMLPNENLVYAGPLCADVES